MNTFTKGLFVSGALTVALGGWILVTHGAAPRPTRPVPVAHEISPSLAGREGHPTTGRVDSRDLRPMVHADIDEPHGPPAPAAETDVAQAMPPAETGSADAHDEMLPDLAALAAQDREEARLAATAPKPVYGVVDPQEYGFKNLEELEARVRERFQVPADVSVRLGTEVRDGQRGLAMVFVPRASRPPEGT